MTQCCRMPIIWFHHQIHIYLDESKQGRFQMKSLSRVIIAAVVASFVLVMFSGCEGVVEKKVSIKGIEQEALQLAKTYRD